MHHEMAASGAGAVACAGAGGDGDEPTFRAYPSLQPDRGAAAVCARLKDIVVKATGSADAVSESVAVVTPKIHGSNLQIHFAPASGVRFGRRNAFLKASEDHYGARKAAAALDMDAKMKALYEHVVGAGHADAAAVTVYLEVYGGSYPHPGVKAVHGSKVVQLGVWYSPGPALVAFDVQVQTGSGAAPFLGFRAAEAACAAAGIPFVPAAFSGTIDAACEFAGANAACNALAHYNPLGLPLIEGNAGEGFVVRTVEEFTCVEDDEPARALSKLKNPSFTEVAYAPKTPAAATPAGADPAEELAKAIGERFLLPARAAAVASKMAESDVCMKNLKALAEALAADARADPVITPEEAAAISGNGKGAKAFAARAFAVMKAFLTARG